MTVLDWTVRALALTAVLSAGSGIALYLSGCAIHALAAIAFSYLTGTAAALGSALEVRT